MILATKTRADLLKRLDPYWKMEAANVLFVPAFLIWLSDWRLSWITLAPMVAIMLLLVIGTLYWRGKVRQLRGDGGDFSVLLRRISSWRQPALALTLCGCVSAMLGWLVPSWSAGLADRNIATGCAVLAVLEYINYYHRQLQHFDNRDDFQRLLAGKGFRKSWLARDIEVLNRPSTSPKRLDFD
jgi:hypothetical protein